MNNCPYSLGCSRVYKKFSEASGWDKGVLAALSAYYAPCKKNGTFPNKGFSQGIEAHGCDAGSLQCFSGYKVAEMEDAPVLAEVFR